MALEAGTRLGAFEIVGLIGAGGMGEVYRAVDTRLDRHVAIKVLPEAYAADPERVARFGREAKSLAALNHQNIGAIHGVEELDGLTALVLELVEGPTLADRIAQGRIPLDEALPIARQIAEALGAAHEHGIIHRDLKPANIKLRPDGTVKVLDFGLAKARAAEANAPAAAALTQSPTITNPALLTGAGIILGTAAYMSPEQAKGLPADRRGDVWAFGCVFYEMLSGKRAFEGEDVSDTLAAILRTEPDWTVLPADVPPAIATLLAGCLARDPRRRIAGLSAALFVIDHKADLVAAVPSAGSATLSAPTPLWRRAIPAAVVLAAALVSGFAAWTFKRLPSAPLTRLAIPLAPTDRLTTGGGSTVALSPDGSRLVFAANDRLYLRALDQLEPTVLAGGDSAPLASPRSPFFSPDGEWVGYWEAGQLRKVSVRGGASAVVCELSPPPSGATWSDDGTILIGRFDRGIWRVSAAGGTAERIIGVDADERAASPQLLPDGRNILFTLGRSGNWDESDIVVQSIDTGARRTVVTGGKDGRHLGSGHLVYALRGRLLGLPFDLSSLTVSGGPVPLVDGMWQIASSSSGQFAVSSTGTLVYVPPITTAPPLRTLVWVDRQGREEIIPAQPAPYSHPRLSPDGTRLVLEALIGNQVPNIWMWDFTRKMLTRITSDPTGDREPLWTPDGQRLIFAARRTGEIALFSQLASGSGRATQLAALSRQSNVSPTISPDGRYVVIREADRGNSYLAVIDLGDRLRTPAASSDIAVSTPLVKTSFEEYNADISPNGRWIAYTSNDAASFDIYVRPFPDALGGLWQVSTGGGTEPLWARNGGELFYRSPKGAVMRVAVATGPTWTASQPTLLFEGSSYVLAPTGNAAVARTYDISPDGRRFVMMKSAEASPPSARPPVVVVVQNWVEELKRLVPTN